MTIINLQLGVHSGNSLEYQNTHIMDFIGEWQDENYMI